MLLLALFQTLYNRIAVTAISSRRDPYIKVLINGTLPTDNPMSLPVYGLHHK